LTQSRRACWSNWRGYIAWSFGLRPGAASMRRGASWSSRSACCRCGCGELSGLLHAFSRSRDTFQFTRRRKSGNLKGGKVPTYLEEATRPASKRPTSSSSPPAGDPSPMGLGLKDGCGSLDSKGFVRIDPHLPPLPRHLGPSRCRRGYAPRISRGGRHRRRRSHGGRRALTTHVPRRLGIHAP